MARKGRVDRGLVERPKGSGRWYVRLYHDGREHWFGPHATKTLARDFYDDRKKDQRDQRLYPETYHKRRAAQLTLGAWIDTCLAGCTLKTKADWERFGKWFKKTLGKRAIKSIETHEFRTLRSRLLARHEAGKGHRGPSTINRYFNWLRHILNLALIDRRIDRNPLNKFGGLPEPSGPDRILSLAEEARLGEVMIPEDFDMVLIAVHTGMRQNEQFSLRWQQIDFENAEIILRKTKTGKPRRVPLNQTALAALQRQKSWLTSPYVFPSLMDTQKPRNATHFYNRTYLPVLKAAGIEGATWHTLRHTTATRLMIAGVDYRTVMGIMGWTRIEMLKRYTSLVPEKLREAVNLLDQNRTPTVTKTGNNEGQAKEENVQVTENIGAPGVI